MSGLREWSFSRRSGHLRNLNGLQGGNIFILVTGNLFGDGVLSVANATVGELVLDQLEWTKDGFKSFDTEARGVAGGFTPRSQNI